MTKTAKQKFLKVIGRLYPDNRLVLRKSYLTDVPPEEILDHGEITVDIYDRKNKHVQRGYAMAKPYHVDDSYSQNSAVRGKIPCPTADVGRIVYSKGVDILLDQKVGLPTANLRLLWDPRRKTVDGKQSIQWSAAKPEDVELEYFVRFSHDGGKTWYPLGTRTKDLRQTVDFDRLPGGARCKLSVMATDGFHCYEVTTPAFRVARKPCDAMILNPDIKPRIREGEPLILQGQGLHREAGRVEKRFITWTSSIDGKLGSGSTFVADKLSPGKHTITMIAGRAPYEGKAVMSVTVLKNGK